MGAIFSVANPTGRDGGSWRNIHLRERRPGCGPDCRSFFVQCARQQTLFAYAIKTVLIPGLHAPETRQGGREPSGGEPPMGKKCRSVNSLFTMMVGNLCLAEACGPDPALPLPKTGLPLRFKTGFAILFASLHWAEFRRNFRGISAIADRADPAKSDYGGRPR